MSKANANIDPPKWPDRILKWFCSEYYYDEVQGDLHEWFYLRVEEQGFRKAKLLYPLDVIRYFRSFRLKSKARISQNSKYQFMKQILKLTYRNLRKDRLSGLLRVSNLTIGIGIFLLTLIYAKYELNYDNFYSEPENIYRVSHNINTNPWAATPMGLGAFMENNISDVEAMTRFFPVFSTTVKAGENVFVEKDGFYVDTNVFKVFDHPVIAGNIEEALSSESSIVLTESMARKYFGRTDVIGETIELEEDRGELRQVSLVIEDVPEQSHLQFDYLISLEVYNSNFLTAWRNWATYTYVRLNKEADFDRVKTVVENEYRTQYRADDSDQLDVLLTPVSDIHLNVNYEKELADNGNANYLYILLCIGAFVLVISGINFTNLTLVKGFDRSKEVGLRKTVGASRHQVISQFLGETFVVLLVSAVLGLLLLALAAPTFRNFSGLNLPLNVFNNPQILLPVLLIIVTLAIICGIYPASVLSNFKPSQVLKSGGQKLKSTKLGLLRRGLIVLQFTISIVLVAGSFVIYNQLNHIQNQNLGFEKDQVLVIPVSSSPLSDGFVEKFEAFRPALMNVAGVKSVSVSSSIPSNRIMVESVQVIGSEKQLNSRLLLGDEFLIDTYGLKLVAGENVKAHLPNTPYEYILNESAAKVLFENEDPINKKIVWNRDTGRVAGIVADFNFESLHHKVEPLVIGSNTRFGWISVRFEPKSMEALRNGIEKISQELYPNLPPIEYELLDDRFEHMYLSEARLRTIVWMFCIISIILTISGIFGMATYLARQRTKEIAVRKVLGSKLSDLLKLLSKDFLLLLCIALALAIPTGVYISKWWLQGFANSISMSPWIFIVSGFSLVLLVMGSAGYVTLKASSVNPAEALKNE